MATSNREIITLLSILAISELILSQETTSTMVECRTDRNCRGSPVNSTIKDCCDHDIDPSGFAYTIPGVDGCQLCPVDFGFSQSSFSGMEQGESYRVQVKFFSGGITTGFFFFPSLDLSGTASSSDISLTTTRGRFLPSDVLEPKDVEFSLSVDNIAQEINETFAIVLELQFGGGNVTIRDRLEGVVIDSDEITFQLSEVDYTQNEEPNALMEVLITKRSGIQLANPVYFRVTPLTIEDALARGIISEFDDENPLSPNRANYEDFNDSSLYLEFPTDRSAVEVTIPIVDDDIDEADDQVFIIFLEVINATNLDNLNILENREISVGRILDDEIIRIGFEHQSYEVSEPNPDDDNVISNLVYLIRENDQATEQTYSVDLTVGDPGRNFKPATIETSNTNQNFDYSLGLPDQTKVNVLFPPTVDRISFVFSLKFDLSVEETETFRATSAQVTPSGPYPVFQTPAGVTAFATTLIHILDNDELIVGFEELNYTVSESAGTVEVCVIVISPPPTADLDFTVALTPSTVDGTAEVRSDFTRLTGCVGSLTAVSRRECFNVTITDDDTLENTESFSLLLQEDVPSQTGTIISPNRTEIFILDDDVPFHTQGPTLDPNTMVECRTNHSCGGSPVTSTIKDCCDHDIEPSGFAYTIPGNQACHLCPVDFGFNQSTFSGSEQGENYRIPIKFFSGGVGQRVYFNVNLGRFGTTDGNDITLVTTQLRFLPGDIQQNLEFSLSVDNITQELDETFVITIEIPDDVINSRVNIRNRLEGVIIDSDEIDFQLSKAVFTQNEEPNALMEVSITKGSGVALVNPVYFKVTSLTVDDAIARGVIGEFEDENPFSPNRANYEDFESTTLFATFNDTVSSRELIVPIVDDDIDEADEQTFIIFLELVNATNFNKVNVNRNTSIGRIRDDETIRIGFEHLTYEVTEPNPDDDNMISNLVYLIREDNQATEQTYSVDLTVGDPGGNTKPATIETSNTNQSFDYSLGAIGQTKRNVLFPPTMNRMPFVFSLNPDLIVEGNETFRATSAPVTPSGNFSIFQAPTGVTAFATTLIHILDNDELRVGFEELNYTVGESAGTVEVCVVVISPPPTEDLDITVALSPSTMDGTAEAGSDFTQLRELLSISLVFPSSPGSPTAGPRRECFNVTITNDNLFENTESFSLLLQEDTFSSQTGVIIIPDQPSIFILDNDGARFGFDPVQYTVNEGAGSVTLFVALLDGTLEREVNLQFSTVEGTPMASAPADYQTETRNITFSSSVSNVSISVTIYDDNILESTEHFFGNLADPRSRATVSIMPNTASVDIMDNDRVTIGFERTNYFVDEGNVVDVCVVLTGTLGRSLDVFVNSSSGSATVAEDYNPVLETLTFVPTSNRACFNFTTLDDEVFEENIEDVNLHLSTMVSNAILGPFLAQVQILNDERTNTISNNQSNNFAIVVVGGVVVLLIVVMVIIVIVIIMVLRYRHSALDLQMNSRSEPLQTIKSETVEEGLYSHVYDAIYQYNETSSQPTPTQPPTLPPIPASRNGGYKLTTCPAYAPTNIQSTLETKDGHFETVANIEPTIPPDSGNGEYEFTKCPAYAPTNIQNSPSDEAEDTRL